MVEFVDEEEIAEEIEVPDIYDEGESDNPLIAVEDGLDNHGTFAREKDGTLAFADFMIFKEIIYRQSLRLFGPKKGEIT